MTTAPRAAAATPLPRPSSRANRFRRRQGWVVGVAVLLGILVFWRYSQIPAFGPFEVRGIVAGTMTLALLAMAQSVIVISGGIDLSVGAMMVLANCIAARLMLDQDLGPVVLVALGVVAVAMLLSGLIGLVTVVSGVPDIVVTLAASFILAGLALVVLDGPGGGTHPRFQELMVGGFDQPLPSLLWLTGLLALVWVPFKRSRLPWAVTGPPPSCPASASAVPGWWPTSWAASSPAWPGWSPPPSPAAASRAPPSGPPPP
jgi:ribose transport system permease protein